MLEFWGKLYNLNRSRNSVLKLAEFDTSNNFRTHRKFRQEKKINDILEKSSFRHRLEWNQKICSTNFSLDFHKGEGRCGRWRGGIEMWYALAAKTLVYEWPVQTPDSRPQNYFRRGIEIIWALNGSSNYSRSQLLRPILFCRS